MVPKPSEQRTKEIAAKRSDQTTRHAAVTPSEQIATQMGPNQSMDNRPNKQPIGCDGTKVGRDQTINKSQPKQVTGKTITVKPTTNVLINGWCPNQANRDQTKLPFQPTRHNETKPTNRPTVSRSSDQTTKRNQIKIPTNYNWAETSQPQTQKNPPRKLRALRCEAHRG